MVSIFNFETFLIGKSQNISESSEFKSEVDDIINIVIDVIEEYNAQLKSPHGDMRYQDYLDKNNRYEEFKPVFKAGNKIRSKFKLVFHRLENYEKVSSVIEDMKSVIGRLSDEDWSMYDMKLGTSRPQNDIGDVTFTFLSFNFSKKDKVLDESERPTEKQIEEVFNKNTQLVTHTGDIYIYDNYVDIGFDSKTYDGDIPKDIDDSFDKVCDLLGFGSYERDRNDKWGVRFWFDDETGEDSLLPLIENKKLD